MDSRANVCLYKMLEKKFKESLRMEPVEKLYDKVQTVNGFCYLGDRLNAIDGCEAVVTGRIRLGWVKFRKYSMRNCYMEEVIR